MNLDKDVPLFSFDEVTSDSDDDEEGDQTVSVGGGRRRRRLRQQNRQRVGDDKVTRMKSLGNW